MFLNERDERFMIEIVSTELKSDLLAIYKTSGDLLNELEMRELSCRDGETRELIELIKFRLMDFMGTLQKDIYNFDYLISKSKMLSYMDEVY